MSRDNLRKKGIGDQVNVGKLALKNRLIRSAVWEALAGARGEVTESLTRCYTALARGGAGLIITGNTAVDSHDEGFANCMRLSDDWLVPQYRTLVDAVHSEKCPIFAQLALSAWSRPVDGNGYREVAIDDMTEDELKHVIDLFTKAAGRANHAGFDGVEIHAAHFFFLSRSLSPLINKRSDRYGGTVEKRATILLDIIGNIRRMYPELAIGVKINCEDFMPGGVSVDDSIRTSLLALEAGADAIDISGNNAARTKIKTEEQEAYFADCAARLAEKTEKPVILTGGLRSLAKIQELLANTSIDLFALARPLIREPDLPRKFLHGESEKAKCISCNGCFKTPGHQCVFELRHQ